MREKYPAGFYSLLLILGLGVFAISNSISRDETTLLLVAYTCCFLSYLLLLQEKQSYALLLGAGIGFRIITVFSLPTLSDDLYRFIWDGTLSLNGFNPFEQLPAFHLDKDIPNLSQELFSELNSPLYFTIYPPINQLLFSLAAFVGNGNWLLSALVLRTIIMVADLLAFFFLQKILVKQQRSKNLAFVYLLNPLVILEFTGNLHFEGIVICFLLMGLYYFQTDYKLGSTLGFGLAIATKLLPLIYLPAVLLAGIGSKKWFIAIGSALVAIGTFLPMLNIAFFEGIQSSLGLYFQKFEFNASFYFLARKIGFILTGYNQIAFVGPLLSCISTAVILALAFIGKKKKWQLEQIFLASLSIYLLFATTVHPWYILPLIPLGVLAGYYSPVTWSFLIFFSYSGYSQSGFELPNWIVVLEYILLLVSIYLEWKLKKVN